MNSFTNIDEFIVLEFGLSKLDHSTDNDYRPRLLCWFIGYSASHALIGSLVIFTVLFKFTKFLT